MVFFRKRLVSFSLIIAFCAALAPALVSAQTADGVSPSSIVNDANKTITITGTLFESGAVVALDGYGNLSTTFVNDTTLKAVVPAGVPAGQYMVTVTLPSSSTPLSVSNPLLVEDPSP